MLDVQRVAQTSPREVILVVDDDPAVLDVLGMALRWLDYVVLEARNGEEALVALQDYHSPVHAVVTDIMMPEMNGLELATMLHDWYPGLRFLFVSAYVRPDITVLTALEGRSRFLHKPFTIQRLGETLRSLLEMPVESVTHGRD